MLIRVFLAGLLLSVFAASALAAGPYATVSGGVSLIHDQDINYASGATATAELKTGYGINLGAGYDFDAFRVEFEFGYKNADVDKFKSDSAIGSGTGSDTSITSYMVNAYYDFLNKSKFTPYVGMGLGMVNGELTSPGFKGDDTVFGYQFIVGSAFKVAPRIVLDLSYRFQAAAKDFALEGGSQVSYKSSNIVAGLRYNF